MTEVAENGEFSRIANIIRIFVFIILIITAFSTIRYMLYPLLPDSEEYKGSFPENFQENLADLPAIFFRHVVLFHEYYDYPVIISLLTRFFLLLLVLSIWNAVNDVNFLKNPKRIIESYSVWAISSLLIAIVFITKEISPENIATVGLGVLVFAISIYALYFSSQKIKKGNNSKE